MKTYLNVHIQPRAKKTEIVGMHGDKLKIKIAAPPVDNLANEELIKFLAQHYDIPKNKIELIRGHKSRDKVLCIEK